MNISVEKQSKNPQALPEVVSLTWIDVLFGVVLLAAAVLRLLDLGVVPLNSAEAQQALSVWQFGQPGRAVGEIVSPAYFTLTSLVHPFFGDHDWVMRLVPALFGMATVALPWLLRKHIGAVGATAAALLLAVSPLNVAISRTAGGDAIAVFALMLLLVAWLRYRVDYQRPWGIVAAVALGLGVTSAPLFYSGLLTFVVAWLLHWLVGPVFMVGDEELQRGFGRRNWLPMGVAALATAVVVGSFFFLAPAGWGATAEIAADWLMQFGFSGGVVTLVEPILLLIRYEPILVLLSVVAIIWAVWGNRPFGSLLSYWLLAGLVLVLFQNGVAANALVLTLPAFLLLGRVTDLILNTISSFWAWIMTGVVLLFGALVLTNATRFLRVARNDPNDVSHLYLILIAIVVLSVVAYYIWAVDDSAVLPGFWLGLMIFLLVYQWGTAWWLTHGPVQDLREAWVSQATDDDLPVMMNVLRNISRAATNSDNEIDILSTVEDPVLRWYLRHYEDATFAATLPTATTASVVITPIAEAEPPAGTDYFGSDFGIFQKYESLTPQNASSILDTLRWWLFHEAITPIEEERIILWVRADLTQTP